MNLIAKNNQTMSSREIASLLECRHGDVCRSIDRLIEAGAISGYTPTPYTHEQNKQTYFEYFISKRDSYVIVAQLSPTFTARLVDRWQELESQQSSSILQIPNFNDPVEAARAWADEKEKTIQQAEQLKLAAPKVEFVDKYVAAETGNLGFRAVCKLIGAKEPEFRKFLTDKKIMYRLGGDWVPFQNHADAGRFAVKAGIAEHGESTHAYNQAKFTPKGVTWVAGEFAKYKIELKNCNDMSIVIHDGD